MTLSNELVVGIAKGLNGKIVSEASSELDVGTYLIDALVHVTGQVKKGEQAEQVVHMAVPQWAIIAVLLSKVNGVTIDAVVREALSLPDEAVTAVKKQAAKAIDQIKVPAKKMVAGKVTTKLEFALAATESDKDLAELTETEVVSDAVVA